MIVGQPELSIETVGQGQSRLSIVTVGQSHLIIVTVTVGQSELSIYTVGQSQLWTHLDVPVPEADGGDVSAVRVSALYTRDARVQLRGEVTHARLPGAVPQTHNLNTAVRIII